MEEEIWKDIPDYEGLYQVSNLGRVKRIIFTNNKYNFEKETILKGWITRGYRYVSLCNNGFSKKYRVHRLVAEAFIPNPDNLPMINHKDENKQNNNAKNLEWCTQKENLDKYFIPRRTSKYKSKK